MEAAWTYRQQGLTEGEAFTGTHPLPNGRTIIVLIRPMPDGGWVAVFEDVTAQRRLEQQLRQQFDRMNTRSATWPRPVPVRRRRTVVMCNEQYLRLYDLDPAS